LEFLIYQFCSSLFTNHLIPIRNVLETSCAQSVLTESVSQKMQAFESQAKLSSNSSSIAGQQSHIQYQLIEHVLHGSVSNALIPETASTATAENAKTAHKLLFERLKGCTDKHYEFFEHESSYVLSHYGVAGAPSFEVKVRRSCFPQHKKHWSENTASSSANSSHQIRYKGMNDQVRDKSKSTITRTVISVAASPSSGSSENEQSGLLTNSPSRFLEQLGFRLNFHFVVKGTVFIRHNIKITVSQIYRVLPTSSAGSDPISTAGGIDHLKETYADNELQLISDDKYLVEATATHPPSVAPDEIAEELRGFVDNLKPLVFMDKIDHR